MNENKIDGRRTIVFRLREFLFMHCGNPNKPNTTHVHNFVIVVQNKSTKLRSDVKPYSNQSLNLNVRVRFNFNCT